MVHELCEPLLIIINMRLLVLEMWTHMLADLSLNLARISFPHHNPVSVLSYKGKNP